MDADILIAEAQTYRALLLARATNLTKNTADAEDVVSEAILKAYRNAAKYDPLKGKLCWWLLTLVKNTFISRYRTVKRIGVPMDLDGFASYESFAATQQLAMTSARRREDPIDILIQDRSCEFVLAAISNLAPHYRSVFELTMQNLSSSEIAGRLQIKVNTVRSRFFRARAALIAAVKRERGEPFQRISNTAQGESHELPADQSSESNSRSRRPDLPRVGGGTRQLQRNGAQASGQFQAQPPHGHRP